MFERILTATFDDLVTRPGDRGTIFTCGNKTEAEEALEALTALVEAGFHEGE